MSWRRQLSVRVLGVVVAAVLVAGCSDPYGRGAGVNTAASSSTSSSSTSAAGSSTSAQAAASPDLDQSGGGGVGPSSAEITAAAGTARAFLPGYVLYTYGRGSARAIVDGDPGLVAQLVASPPAVPPAVRARHPRVTELSVSGGDAAQVALQAVVSDGVDTYAIPLTVSDEKAGWLVTSVQ
jgi:hypothetical protein